MKKLVRLFSLLVTVLVVAAFAATAFAAESTIIYRSRADGYEFAPGSVYTETDLFENFKNVMPGDVRSEVVTITNENTYSDYIQVYMRALLHDEEGNPISPKVLEEIQKDDRKGTLSELEYMHDFLKQLTLTVWKGEKKDENIIYQGSPDSLESGFESKAAHLGYLYRGRSMTLNVELAVSVEMGNEYADRIGEVDWVFVIEEYDDPDPLPTPTPTPEPEVTPEPVPTPVITEIPDEPDAPKTGDTAVIWPYILLIAVGLIGMIATAFRRRRRD